MSSSLLSQYQTEAKAEAARAGLCLPEGSGGTDGGSKSPVRRSLLGLQGLQGEGLPRDGAVAGRHSEGDGARRHDVDGIKVSKVTARIQQRILEAASEIDKAKVNDWMALVTTGMVDVLEVCCSSQSLLAKEASKYYKEVYRFGIWNGYDLATATGRDRALRWIRASKPRRMWASPPCSPRSAHRQKMNMDAQKLLELTQARRETAQE